MTTQSFDNYASTEITKAFIQMVKFEMLLSGKSFNECKEVVKEFLRAKNLL